MKTGKNTVQKSIEDALQKRDIEDLIKKMEEGFEGVHKRQDMTNGKVLKATADIVEIKNWRSFINGGLAVLTILILPILFILFRLLLEKS